MKASEVLRQARELISMPELWVQRAFAKDRLGHRVACASEEAVCWCAYGALSAVAHRNGISVTWNSNLHDIIKFNDTTGRSHAEVLQVFDKAIEQAKKEET